MARQRWKSKPRARDEAEWKAKQVLREMQRFEEGSRVGTWLREHKRWIAVALAVLVVAAVLYALRPGPQEKPPVSLVPPDSRFLGDELIQGPLFHELTWNSCTADFRPDYGLPCEDQLRIFGRLPKVPRDLVDVANLTFWTMIRGGKLDLGRIPDAYWKQPEFYPSWRWEDTVRSMQASGPFWTPYGFGSYPGTIAFNVSSEAAGGSVVVVDAYAYFRASWNVSTWQGVVLYAAYPTEARAANGSVVFRQDPARAREAVSMAFMSGNDTRYDALRSMDGFLTNVPLGGRFILLGPTRQNFTADGPTADCEICAPWVVRLQMRLTIRSDMPGSYVIAVMSMNPGDWINEQFGSPTGTYRIGSYYVPSGDWHGDPVVQLVVQVQ